ncbi:MAG: hypothetical protein OMM_06487 [Candidatus Magnetoglobus multicellularis str. Araruama]|uniref:Uncharacterized protein n=1 Tax=Candidatus Magnetoglobus multicellularis str. Araruama TaxID=890399 RepID=A0A1V1PHC3_9BACT|nr:MAG: hypothetical protein OMM_06487 [Candidatus Magnetoglobus multicellularis str. Araruama]
MVSIADLIKCFDSNFYTSIIPKKGAYVQVGGTQRPPGGFNPRRSRLCRNFALIDFYSYNRGIISALLYYAVLAIAEIKHSL